VDLEGLSGLGREVHTAFHEPADFDDVLYLIFNIPNRIAECFRLKSVIFLIDHVECASANVNKALCRAIKNSPFILASRNGKMANRRFGRYPIQGMIDIEYENRIVIREYPCEIGIEDMMGCPGFIIQFKEVCELILENSKKLAFGGKGMRIKSKIQQLRNIEIDHRLSKLVAQLAEAGSETIEHDLANVILKGEMRIQIVCEK
jgi:hypothetical protein